MAIRKRVKRIERDDLYKKWESKDGFQEIKGQAIENNVTVGQQLEAESPTDPQKHKYSSVDEILFRRGYDLYDESDGYILSSPMKAFGSWTQANDVPYTEEANDRLLLDEHLGKSYASTLITGVKTKNLELVKSLHSIGGLETGTVFNPYYDAPIMRAKLFGPAIDYRRIVGDIVRIRENVYKLTKYNNDPDERKMDRMAEGASPRMMELDYSEDTLRFELFRKGIEATYDYLNDEQTRVSMVRNAIEEVAEQHRIAIFEMVVTEIDEAHISTNAMTASGGVDGKITLSQWLRFRKTFGPMYSPDIVLGRGNEITQFEMMFMHLGGQTPEAAASHDLGYTSHPIPANSMLYSNPRLLNNVPTIPEYGWYDDLDDVLLQNNLLCFDRERSSRLVFQIGSEQDETQRHPGPRVVQRFLATKAGVEVPDPNGIRKFVMQS